MKTVMVVGAGLAGNKAALDLAEAGFEVYLVEKTPFWGGTMPKLDKMFPTHDCLICTLSPDTMDLGCKLSSINRHPNIKTIVNAEIIDFTGKPGNFKVVIKGAFIAPNEQLTSCITGINSYTININVASVILCPGYKITDPSEQSYYGYGKYPNVVTALEFESILKEAQASTSEVLRLDNKEPARKIAWVQCVGSRNERINKGYCSSVCCMFAIKEAMMAKEISSDTETKIFLMDLKIHGKGYYKYQQKAEKDFNVKFIYSRIHMVLESPDNGNLIIRYAAEDGTITTEEFDLVVLSTGMEQPKEIKALAEKFGIMLDECNFSLTQALTGVCTTKPGIFSAGAFSGPKDIPESIIQASACAAEAAVVAAGSIDKKLQSLNQAPAQAFDVTEEPRIGVFLCSCLNQLNSILDFSAIENDFKNIPVHILDNLCSSADKEVVQKIIRQKQLNRIVIAACSSKINSFLVKQLETESGLSESFLQTVNIREQCAWVHSDKPEKATAKALDQIRMAVIRLSMAKATVPMYSPVIPEALIIGGGLAGLTAALYLAKLGFIVHLVEKTNSLGGIATRLKAGLKGENIPKYLNSLTNEILNHPYVNVYLNAEVKSCVGHVGNFTSKLSTGELINHAVSIIATGGQEAIHKNGSDIKEYLYGQSKLVYTQLQLEQALYTNDPVVKSAKNIVMIQCVGSREENGKPYCSRLCCTKSINQALQLKEKDPSKNIFILYRDINTYGTMDKFYTKARRKGIIFIRYGLNNKPVTEEVIITDKKIIKVLVDDHILGTTLEIEADLLCLATGIEASPENPKIASIFDVSLDENGFFKEMHLKLRPVDLKTDGVFVCGLAHAPKSAEETITQAKAAVGRSCTVLYQDFLQSPTTVAVHNGDCAACLTCVRTCPYNVPKIVDNKVFINPTQCRGCGICTSECPLNALELQNLTNETLVAMIKSLF